MFCIVPRPAEQEEIICKAHKGKGHSGVKRAASLVKAEFGWTQYYVGDFVLDCWMSPPLGVHLRQR